MPDVISSIALKRFTTFGDLLKYLRRRTGMTQRELSIAVGYSDAQICRLEQNERLPNIATLTARFLPVLMLEDCPEAAERLLELAANMRKEDAPSSGQPPYKGLFFFDETDAELFFGREDLVSTVIDRIRDGLKVDQRFLAIIGASGSGKSSLVRAGVIPALGWNREFAGWINFVLTPTSHPLKALSKEISTPAVSPYAPNQLSSLFTSDPEGLDRSLVELATAAGAEHVLLVIDQFEELFTLCRDQEEQQIFIDNLLNASNQPDGVASVLIAMRSDFYAHCARFKAFRQALAQNQEYIGPMSTEELRQVIEKPAEQGRWEIESGLVDLMLHDIGADSGRLPEPGALPLLSHALLETWQRRRGRILTISGYTASGGIRGAIAETAEAVFQDQLEPEQRNIARQIFLRLTEIGSEDTTTFTRRRVGIDELVSKPEENAVIEQVLLMLANARLITMEQDAVEVAHEALIREWPTLLNWLEEDQENLRLHRRLTEAAQEWDVTGRDPSGLYRGARLAQAIEWAELHAEAANLLEKEFLDASQQLAQSELKEREEQQQRELEAAQKIAAEQARAAQLQKSRSWWLAGASLIAIALAILALISRSSAQREAAVNHSLVLADQAVEAQERGEVDLALALGLEAVSIESPPPDAVRKLALLADSMGTRAVLTGHNGEVKAGVFSPDGQQAVTGGCFSFEQENNCLASEMILWDISSQEIIARWTGLENWVTALAWTPDGKHILSGSENGDIILWDAKRQYLRRRFELEGGKINTIIISSNSKLAAVADDSGVLTLINLDGRLTRKLQGHTDAILDIAFSPDGTRIVSGSADSTLIVWDVDTGEPLVNLNGHGNSVTGVAFLPDGKQILSASYDLSFRLWDAATGTLLKYRSSGDRPEGMVLTPDGKTVLHHVAHVIYTWQLEEFESPHQKLYGHVGPIYSINISSDGRLVLTSGDDGTVRVWDLMGVQDIEQINIVFDATSLAISPDGKNAALGGAISKEGIGVIWDLTSNKTIQDLPGLVGSAAPGGFDFSPDGKWIAGASGQFATDVDDHALLIWEASTGNIHCNLQGHDRRVRKVAFSPDAKKVLSGTQGTDDLHELILWDIEKCRIVHQFEIDVDTTGIDFSDDGRYALTSAAEGRTTLWNIETGQVEKIYPAPGDPLIDTAFGPKEETVLSASINGVIIQWDRETGDLIRRFSGHEGGVWSITISPNEQWMASSDDTGMIILWDLETGSELLRDNTQGGNTMQVAFSPDGQTVYSVSRDGTLVIWEVGDPSLSGVTAWLNNHRYIRELTCEEREQYNIEPLCD